MKEKEQNKTAIFPTISNPPTFGTVEMLLRLAEKYETVIVLVYNKPGILTTADIVARLGYVLDSLAGKFIVMGTDIDFAHLNYFPKDENGKSFVKDKDIITTSKTIYANLVGKEYRNVLLLEQSPGYNESFHRIAYTRSLMLYRLRQTCKLKR